MNEEKYISLLLVPEFMTIEPPTSSYDLSHICNNTFSAGDEVAVTCDEVQAAVWFIL